jgi:hypothetical protein
MSTSPIAEPIDSIQARHGWIQTETVKTRFGNFEFKNGYPTRETADALLDRHARSCSIHREIIYR